MVMMSSTATMVAIVIVMVWLVRDIVRAMVAATPSASSHGGTSAAALVMACASVFFLKSVLNGHICPINSDGVCLLHSFLRTFYILVDNERIARGHQSGAYPLMFPVFWYFGISQRATFPNF